MAIEANPNQTIEDFSEYLRETGRAHRAATGVCWDASAELVPPGMPRRLGSREGTDRIHP